MPLAGADTHQALSDRSSPYIVDFAAVLRVWDARDGRKVLRADRTLCRFGARLYPHALCE
jgi:hypothetical protein